MTTKTTTMTTKTMTIERIATTTIATMLTIATTMTTTAMTRPPADVEDGGDDVEDDAEGGADDAGDVDAGAAGGDEVGDPTVRGPPRGEAGRSVTDAYDLVIFDLDGVVYLGTEPVPGAAEAISPLWTPGSAVAYVTNNASRRGDRGGGAARTPGRPGPSRPTC